MVNKVELIKKGTTQEAKKPFLPKECLEFVQLQHDATYPLDQHVLLEFGTDGAYIVTNYGESYSWTEAPKYDAVEPVYTPLFWAGDVVNTTKPVKSYEANGDTYEE